MIIITEQSEQRLAKWLEESNSYTTTPRAIHIKRFDALYGGNDTEVADHISHYLFDALKDAEVNIFQCHDGDLVITGKGITTQHYKHIDMYLATHFGLAEGASIFYERNVNWYPFTSLCGEKLNALFKQKQDQKDAAKIAKKEKARNAALNQRLPEELLDNVAKRRSERDRLEIVIVEDDPFSRKLVSNSLQDHYPTSVAVDGRDAIAAYVHKAPDVMFLDIDLPDITGHEVLQKVLEVDPSAYVIMLSANGDKDNVLNAVSHGAKGFVAKPFTKDKLFSYIEKAPTYSLPQ